MEGGCEGPAGRMGGGKGREGDGKGGKGREGEGRGGKRRQAGRREEEGSGVIARFDVRKRPPPAALQAVEKASTTACLPGRVWVLGCFAGGLGFLFAQPAT